MTSPFKPYVSFVLGPPADPEFRAHFDEAQDKLRSGGEDPSDEETCIQLDPRIPIFVARQESHPSFLSEAISLALESPVEVVEPTLSWGYFKGELVAQIQIEPRHVKGPRAAVDRLFEGGSPVQAIVSLLGLLLKLDWVRSIRPVPDWEEVDTEPEKEGTDAT